MVKKKIDNRIRVMIENGVKIGERTMFVIVGDKGRDQIPILYDLLTKSTVKARPTVLWCYKNKDEAISNHGKKRTKKILSGVVSINEADIFDTFRASTTIHGRYYKDTHTVLGRTYSVCVLQDFEAITPNLLARTIETVEGGGLIILLLKTVNSLKQLYTMKMDVHKRFRTEAYQNVTCRFNERLILSLADCKRCLLVNDDLTILPLSSSTAAVRPIDKFDQNIGLNNEGLIELKENLRDTPPAGLLINICKTLDQAKAVVQFIDALAEKQLKPPTFLTASRGRGKSAALGLAISAAVSFGYVNIYVTSPTPDNLITLFEFTFKGFDALEYQEHLDYTIARSTNPEFNNAVIKVNITRNNRQTIQYISPNDAHLLNAADLLIIDEAAAIPLPLVKSMIGSYLIFMASTVNGYEGTGRSLSLKLLTEIQKDTSAPPPINLVESIRYSPGDNIEKWLSSLLCLNDSEILQLKYGCPTPDSCELFYINRNALFSYHKAAESFLQRIVSICAASHYKNSPNDLQMMSDAPAHQLFCLLGPVLKTEVLPDILVVIQVCFEGKISSKSVQNSLSRGMKASGDLIPWNISQQYGDHDFPKLSGARIVRIATHPDYQRMGYGKKALKLLKNYYEGKFCNIDENYSETDDNQEIEEHEVEQVDLLKESILPRHNTPTLLKRLTERKAEELDYIGTSFGLTNDLLKFWKSQKFVPIYLSQKENDLTGEHSCIMVSLLKDSHAKTNNWMTEYFVDFRRRFLKLSSKAFHNFKTGLALSILDNKSVELSKQELTQQILDSHFLPHDIQRLEAYIKNQIEYKLIMDLTTDLSNLYFQNKIPDVHIDALQKAILLGIGLQNKTLDKLADEFNMPASQVLVKFYDCVKKLTHKIMGTMETTIGDNIIPASDTKYATEHFVPVEQSLHEELVAEDKKMKKQRKDFSKKMENLDLYAIKGSEDDWKKALTSSKSKVISVKSGEKRFIDLEIEESAHESKKSKKKIKFQKKQ